MTIITAKLVDWWMRREYCFEGIISNSINDLYPDCHRVTMEFMSVTYYPALNHHWSEHYLMVNNFGEYFKADIKDRRS